MLIAPTATRPSRVGCLAVEPSARPFDLPGGSRHLSRETQSIDVDSRVAYLTARERDVLALLSEGRSDIGIGSALFVTQKTVEFHTRNIFRKLDLPAGRSVNRRVLAALTYLGQSGGKTA